MTNWSEDLTHDGSEECPVPEGVERLLTTYLDRAAHHGWRRVSTYRYDTDQMREHLMDNRVPFGLLLPAERHWFEQQEKLECYAHQLGKWVEIEAMGAFLNSSVYRPIPEPQTGEYFVAGRCFSAWRELDNAKDYADDFVHRIEYDLATDEIVKAETVWRKDDE